MLAEKPDIADDTFTLEPELLQVLVNDMATLASIYHKPASAFVMKSSGTVVDDEDEDEEEYDDPNMVASDGAAHESDVGGGDLLDIGGLSGGSPPPAAAGSSGTAGGDLLSGFGVEPAVAPASGLVVPKVAVPVTGAANGITVSAALRNTGAGSFALDMDFTNGTGSPVQNFALQLNKSSFGISNPAQAPGFTFPAPIAPGATGSVSVPLSVAPGMVAPGDPNANLQVRFSTASPPPPSPLPGTFCPHFAGSRQMP